MSLDILMMMKKKKMMMMINYKEMSVRMMNMMMNRVLMMLDAGFLEEVFCLDLQIGR
jgi:hypothetical protein